MFLLAALLSCASNRPDDFQLTRSELLIDAFYSYDLERLEILMSSASASIPSISYYQGWAEGGNYEIIERKPCVKELPHRVKCSITVRDDPMLALGIDFNVTDTFHISFNENVIISVETTSNDLQVYHDAAAWVRREMPELIREPCQGFFKGGPTPAACARAMTTGYRTFAASKDFPK